MDYGIYVINMDKNPDRLAGFREAFDGIEFTRIVGCPGSTLPLTAVKMLCGGEAGSLGALGCTLAHMSAWEAVARGEEECGLICEDDAELLRPLPAAIAEFELPEDWDLCFVNDRIFFGDREGAPIISCAEALGTFPADHAAPGGDGYLITRQAATKMLSLIEVDNLHFFSDWRMIQYSITPEDALRLPPGTAREVMRVLHGRSKVTDRPLNGYALRNPIVRTRKCPSTLWAEGV